MGRVGPVLLGDDIAAEWPTVKVLRATARFTTACHAAKPLQREAGVERRCVIRDSSALRS
jgi:hypothetical protein